MALSAAIVLSQENRTELDGDNYEHSDLFIGVNITEMCAPISPSRFDVVFVYPPEYAERRQLFTETIPPEILVATRIEKTMCLQLSTIEANPNTTREILLDFLNSWKYIDAPYIFDEKEPQGSSAEGLTDDSNGNHFRHLNGSESWAKGTSESLACSTVGISNAVDIACDELVAENSRAFPKNANETVTITGKTADPLQILIQTLGAATVENAECKKKLKSYVDTYKWKNGGNITTGWIYTHEGNVKTKLNWPKRFIVNQLIQGFNGNSSTCVPVNGEKISVIEAEANTTEKDEDKDVGSSAAPAVKQI